MFSIFKRRGNEKIKNNEKKDKVSPEVIISVEDIHNPYTEEVRGFETEQVTYVHVERVLDIYTGKTSMIYRTEINYFRWLAGLETFIVKGERCNRPMIDIWVQQQAGKLLKHLRCEVCL